MKTLILISACILFASSKLSAQTVITAKDAAKHTGEKVTICDRVFRESNKAFNVGLYLGDSTHYAVVVIKFKYQFQKAIGPDYFHFEGKRICVTGVLKKGSLIKVDDPAQIKIDTAVKSSN
ncbi:MAG: hypothetical protein V4577_14260 [Bacteroidota bacterium]